MKLDISFKRSAVYGCFESLIIPLANWYGKDFELMSIDSWGFSYDSSVLNQIGVLFRESFDSGTYSNFDYLEKFHGLQLVHGESSFDDMVSIIESELSSGKPVIVHNDTYWCPWYKERYNKVYGPHYFLAIGYEKNGVHVIDSQFAIQGAFLPYDTLKKGFKDYYRCNSINDYDKALDWKGLLERSITGEKFSSENNFFNLLRIFSNDIVNKLNLAEEINADVPSSSPVIAFTLEKGLRMC